MTHERYIRQMRLPEIGPAGQNKLMQARVLVVGAGGLAASLLPLLAGAGVGQLIILDHDIVSLSNLHRQFMFRMQDIGRAKVEVMAEVLRSYNPDIDIKAYAQALTPDNVREFAEQVDIIADAADQLTATYILNDVADDMGKPFISASVLGMEGYVGAFCGGGACYRSVFPDMPNQMGSCATHGVLGSAVATLGSIQAHMVLQYLLELDPSPLGTLIRLDLRQMTFASFSFKNAPRYDGPRILFLNENNLLDQDILIDIRSEEETPILPIARAIRVLPHELMTFVNSSPQDQRIVLCCKSGLRAFHLARMLEAHNRAAAVLLHET